MSRLAQYQEQVKDGFGYEEFEAIPKGTEQVFVIEEAVWDTQLNNKAQPPQQDEYIKIRIKAFGGEYDGRVIFQNLNILGRADQDDAKAEKTIESALQFLAAYDYHALGGALAKLPHDPEDEDLRKLEGRKVNIIVGVRTYKNQFQETQRVNTVRQVIPMPTTERPTRTRTADAGASESADTGRRERRPRR